jgi:hypothetical protein
MIFNTRRNGLVENSRVFSFQLSWRRIVFVGLSSEMDRTKVLEPMFYIVKYFSVTVGPHSPQMYQ